MAYAMTKRGNLDNCVTYEFMCDTVQDMNDIEDRYRTIGSIAIVLEGYSGMEVYIAGSDKQWRALSAIGGGSGSSGESESEGAESNLPIYTKTIEGATIEIENVDMNNGNPQEKDIDTTLLREGPVTIEIGDYSYEVELSNSRIEGMSVYEYNDSNFGIALVYDPQSMLMIYDNQHTYNELQTVRIIYPTITKLYSTGNNLYLGADEDGDNGVKVVTTNNGSIAVGTTVTASGENSQAFGIDTIASEVASHAEGVETEASGYASHAEGLMTEAYGAQSHAEGESTKATGMYSHAEGMSTQASGHYSHVEGHYTIARGNYQHVSGKFNIQDNGSIYAEIIGNGTGDNKRSNARALDWSGNEYLKGDLYVGCSTNSINGTKVIPLPTPPTTDGTYTLQCTVSNGTATYSWV